MTDGIIERLAELLSNTSGRAEQAAEIIAEMAKSEDNRIIMVQQAVSQITIYCHFLYKLLLHLSFYIFDVGKH